MNGDDKSPYPNLLDRGIYLFSEDVNEDSCADAIRFILECNMQEEAVYDSITLIINSHGGSVVDGFALLDVMRGSKLPVNTVGIGIIASMGLLIFMGGKHRTLTPNTLILSHQWSGVDWGKEHELVANRKRSDMISKLIMNHYKRCTKLKEKVIKEVLLPPSDVWLTAEEAKKYNICDEIKYL